MFRRSFIWSADFVVIVFQPGEVKTTCSNQDRQAGNDKRLGAGLFQVVGPFLRQKAHLAIKQAHLPRLCPGISRQQFVLGRFTGVRPNQINRAGAEESQHQHDAANHPEALRLLARRIRTGDLTV